VDIGVVAEQFDHRGTQFTGEPNFALAQVASTAELNVVWLPRLDDSAG
jgi:hypothetical protein